MIYCSFRLDEDGNWGKRTKTACGRDGSFGNLCLRARRSVCWGRQGREAITLPLPPPSQDIAMPEIAQYQGPVQKPFLIS